MPQHEYEIITGIVVTIIVFLLAGFFIIVLVAYINQRKKKYIEEKQIMQSAFQQELLSAQLEIQEQTLKNISEEIHDNIGQVLSLAKLHLGTMDKNNAVALEEKIQDSKYLVGKAIQDLRNLSHSMNTDYINEKGLPDSLEYELDMIGKSGVYETVFSAEGTTQKLDKQKELILFRIVQEVLNNIIKHAKAKKITLVIKYQKDQVEMTIADNGEGFDLSPVAENENGKFGLGIKNMHNRARLINATFNIQSTLGKGTIVIITIPYSKPKPE
jgi:two-component system, NarL family, sensor kinase